MGPQQQQFVPWYGYNPFMMGPSVPFGQVAPQQPPSVQQTQPASQPQQPTYYRGRMVDSDADIKPSEVPMDGTVVLFPKTDYSCVYGKTWTQDGLLKPMKFVLEVDTPTESVNEPSAETLTPDALSNLVQQIVQDKLQSALEPVNTTMSEISNAQSKILEELKKKSSSLIVQ